MRKIGELSSEQSARIFSGVLFVRGMESDVEREENGTFSVWVHDDDHRDAAAALLEKFRATPDSPEWSDATRAENLRRAQAREDARRASHVITRERMSYERNFGGFALWPMILAVLSVLVTLWAGTLEFDLLNVTQKQGVERTNLIQITRWGLAPELEEVLEKWHPYADGRTLTESEAEEMARELAAKAPAAGIPSKPYDSTLPEIRQGQLWRLFTPMFLHFGILHLVFNLMWLRDLGSFIEHRFGGRYFLIFALIAAALSNLAQFYLSGPLLGGGNGPNFGGMSGVNYALFGFLWFRGKYDRTVLWRLNPVIVQTMLLWFAACFTPLIPHVANAAHAAGLLFGMAAGFATAKLRRK